MRPVVTRHYEACNKVDTWRTMANWEWCRELSKAQQAKTLCKHDSLLLLQEDLQYCKENLQW